MMTSFKKQKGILSEIEVENKPNAGEGSIPKSMMNE